MQFCKTVECAIQEAKILEGLPLTWVFADHENIGYAVSGSIPLKTSYEKGFRVSNPASKDNSWTWMEAKDKPSELNPPQGYIVAGTDKLSLMNGENLK